MPPQSRKGSAGGTAKIYLDGVFVREVRLAESYPVEGYQKTIFRADGLANGLTVNRKACHRR